MLAHAHPATAAAHPALSNPLAPAADRPADRAGRGWDPLQQTVYKDIDTVMPTNAHRTGGDVRSTQAYATLEGVKIASYRGTGTPTADKCDQAAQVNGDAYQEVRTQGWYCIRSVKGSVAALRVDTIGDDVIDGYAIVWHR